MSQIYEVVITTRKYLQVRVPNGWTRNDVRTYYLNRLAEFEKLVEAHGDESADSMARCVGFEHEMEPEDVEGVPDYDAAAPGEQPSQGGA